MLIQLRCSGQCLSKWMEVTVLAPTQHKRGVEIATGKNCNLSGEEITHQTLYFVLQYWNLTLGLTHNRETALSHAPVFLSIFIFSEQTFSI